MVSADIVGMMKLMIVGALFVTAAVGLISLKKNSDSQPLYETKQELVTYKLTDVEIIKNKAKETNVDISRYNLLVVVEIEEVRHSAKIIEPEFKATYTYEKLVDNKGVKDAQEIKNEFYSSGALILPMNVEAIENEAQETE